MAKASKKKIAENSKVLALDTLNNKFNEIIVNVSSWEKNELKSHNAKLYALLGQCLEIAEHINEKQERVSALNTLYKDYRDHYRGSSSVLAKVVRIAFRDQENRCSAYIKTLERAFKEEINSAGFVEWLQGLGGIEAARLGGKKGPATKELIEIGRGAFSQSTTTLGKVKIKHEAVVRGNTVVLLGRVDNSGNILIQEAACSTSLENQFYAQLGREVQKKKREQHSKSESSSAVKVEDLLNAAYGNDEEAA